MGEWISTVAHRFKAHSSPHISSLFILEFIIDWCVFQQLVDGNAVLLEVLREFLPDIINRLVCKSANYDAGIALKQVLRGLSQRGDMACLLKAREDFLCDCSLTCACGTN